MLQAKDKKNQVSEEIELSSIECSKRVTSLQKRSKHVSMSSKFSKSLVPNAILRLRLEPASGSANLLQEGIQTKSLSAPAVPKHPKHSSQGSNKLWKKKKWAWNDLHLCVFFRNAKSSQGLMDDNN